MPKESPRTAQTSYLPSQRPKNKQAWGVYSRIEEASDYEDEEDNNPLYDIHMSAPKPQSLDALFEDDSDKQLFLRLLTTLRYHPGWKRSGALRNLSKRQYVLDSKLAESGYRYTLGDAIVIRTQWTRDPSGTCGIGDWAGDRFDIRGVGDFPVGWTDVSDETVALLADGPSSFPRRYDYDYKYEVAELRSWIE
ncbi:hypothetical protein F4818DRAFT_287182 [Hypoxylon cercidicola]|nr:hypothetical protein F4818DRAFT_287182 [Hypoxylon cercidicola]